MAAICDKWQRISLYPVNSLLFVSGQQRNVRQWHLVNILARGYRRCDRLAVFGSIREIVMLATGVYQSIKTVDIFHMRFPAVMSRYTREISKGVMLNIWQKGGHGYSASLPRLLILYISAATSREWPTVSRPKFLIELQNKQESQVESNSKTKQVYFALLINGYLTSKIRAYRNEGLGFKYSFLMIKLSTAVLEECV